MADADVEQEAAKFLDKVGDEDKKDPKKLASKFNAMCQHMKTSGKEATLPFKIVSRALEIVLKQYSFLLVKAQLLIMSNLVVEPLTIRRKRHLHQRQLSPYKATSLVALLKKRRKQLSLHCLQHSLRVLLLR